MAASRSRLAGARFRLDQTERAIRLERERVERRTRYLNVGLRQAEVEERAAQATHAVLDSVVATLATLEHRLTALRDASIRRLVRRAERLQATSQEHRIRLGRMRHLYAQGPSESRAEPPPPGWPGPDDLLREEVELSDRTAAFSGDFASRVPALIRESCDAYWRPSLIDRAVTLRALAAEHRAGADALAAGLGGAIAELAAGERLDHLEAIAAARAAEVDSLARADDALRAEVAREMARRSIRSLEDERESIDYGLASVSYARAVARDSSGAPDGDAPARRGEAIARLEEFLERYPSTVVRTDVRFRLADLLVLEEQQRFQDAMRQMAAGNAAGHPAGAALAPDYQAALDLYLAILDDDPGFSHRDAALFNVAMILADDADPRAPSYFEALVAQHPESPLCQTAYLRMGDLLFDGKEYARCAAYYESASAGADANLRVIALYKLGWSHLAEQRHADAADAFRRALDLYEGDTAPSGDGIAGVPLRTDLRSECETYLVEAFARSGGAAAFARYFDEIGARRYETRVLQGLSRFFRDFRLYGDAVDADRLFIQRYAEHPDALASAERLIDTYERWDRADAALDARLELAPLFAPDGPWQSAQAADSLRARGSEFARACWETAAVRHHREARAGGPDAETHWRRALALYEEILERWPLGRPAERFRMRAGEAAAQVREHDRALRHFAAAARSDSLELAVDAAWRRVSVRDAWYDSAGSTPAGDSLAANLLREIDDFAARHPGDPRRSELSWRAGNVAFSRGDYRRAADDFDRLLALPVDRERRARAAALRADALYRIDAFGEAGDAYALARLAARTAGLDSLAARIEPSIPICHYRHAESLAARGGPAVQEAAAEFERFAAAWPSHELADEAQYRAALAEIATDSPVAAVASLRLLIERFPESEHVHDAYLRMASLLEAGGRASDAAAAYAAFASRFPKDDLAPTALLDAADMFESEGATARAEELRLGYIERYPDDVETAMTILLPLVRKELDALPGGTALPSLDAPRAGASAASTPRLAAYLARTAARPNLASPSLMAELRYREAEGRRAKYDALRLTQPLDASIKAKVEVLEKVIAGYQKCAGVGVAEWAHASAYRIGQALVAFGEELKRSDRPADLSPDDLAAYEDVLHERAAEFCVRGEDVWSDLLRSGAGDPDAGGWIATTREALWPRLATRFLYRPEMELPLVGTPARASRTADFAERSSIDATTQAEAN
jgi:TolA-binding protein